MISEFSGGRDDECSEAEPGAPFVAIERLEQRNEESERFAGSGLRCPENVVALKRQRNALSLDVWTGEEDNRKSRRR